jgi:hypothetical protein
MAELKTKPNDKDIVAFLNSIENEQRRSDCFAVLKLMSEITKEEPKMWGETIVGFGVYHYKYASGREGDWFLTGFSPRKQNLTIYIISGFNEYEELMNRLGKFKTGSSCLYINKLADIDLKVLTTLIKSSIKYLKSKYG